MSDTITTNKIKPINGKTVYINGIITANSIQTDTNDSGDPYLFLPAGSIMPFAGHNIPNGFLLCDGREISRDEYSNLFNALGEDWGEGNGSTTFNIPDLRGAFLRGVGLHGTMKKANGNAFSGPRLGHYKNDHMQTARRYIDISARGYPNGSGDRTSNYYLMHPIRGTEYRLETPRYPDNPNGEPREGDETRPFNAGVNYMIRT